MDNEMVALIVKGLLEGIGLIIGYLKIRDHMNQQEARRIERANQLNEKITKATETVKETKEEIITTRDINTEQIKASNNFNEKLLKLQQAITRIDSGQRRTSKDLHEIKSNLGILSDATGIAINQEGNNDQRGQGARENEVQAEES